MTEPTPIVQSLARGLAHSRLRRRTSASNARVPNWSEMASMSALVSVKAGVSASKGTGAVNVLGSTMSAPAKSGDSHGSVNAILGSWLVI